MRSAAYVVLLVFEDLQKNILCDVCCEMYWETCEFLVKKHTVK